MKITDDELIELESGGRGAIEMAKTLLDRQAREAQGAGAATPLRLQAFAIQNDKDASMVFGLGEDGMLYFAPLDNLHGRRQWRLWPVYPPA